MARRTRPAYVPAPLAPLPPVGATVRHYLYGTTGRVVGHDQHLALVDDGTRVREVVGTALDVVA